MLMRSISNYNPGDNDSREYGTHVDAGPYNILDQSVTPATASIRDSKRPMTM